MRSFIELTELHDEIDEMFFVHQHSLLHFKFGAALSQIETYESALLRHMRDEEDILIPVYERLAEFDRAGAPKIFLDDHEKMRRYVYLFKEQTAKLVEEKRPEPGLLLLLDREAFYKRLCSHHDRREAETLYPALDRITSETERADLISQVTWRFGFVHPFAMG